MKGVLAWLDRHLFLLILTVGVLLITATAWSAVKDDPVEDRLLSRVQLTAGNYTALLSLNKAADKPSVLAPDGRILLDISGWDSTVTVNNVTESLGRLESNWGSRGKVAWLTWSSANFSLEERIEATPRGVSVTWSWLRAPDAAAQNVSITVAHFGFFLVNATHDNETVRYELPGLDPRKHANQTVPGYAVTVTSVPRPERVQLPGKYGPSDAFRSTFNVTWPEAGRVTPFAREFIAFERLGVPVTPAPVLYEAMPDATPRDVRLKAGPLAAVFPFESSANRPRLDYGNRTLLDVAGWETNISVNGTEIAPSRLDYKVNASLNTSRWQWRGPGFTLYQNASIDSGGLNLTWSWQRHEPAEDLNGTLTLGLFAFWMENATYQGTQAWNFTLKGHAPWRTDDWRSPLRHNVTVSVEEPPLRGWFEGNEDGTYAVRLQYWLPDEDDPPWQDMFTMRVGVETWPGQGGADNAYLGDSGSREAGSS